MKPGFLCVFKSNVSSVYVKKKKIKKTVNIIINRKKKPLVLKKVFKLFFHTINPKRIQESIKRKLAMKGKISAVFLILSISISPTKSALFDNFAKCLKMAIFHTFENLVILLSINVL